MVSTLTNFGTVCEKHKRLGNYVSNRQAMANQNQNVALKPKWKLTNGSSSCPEDGKVEQTTYKLSSSVDPF